MVGATDADAVDGVTNPNGWIIVVADVVLVLSIPELKPVLAIVAGCPPNVNPPVPLKGDAILRGVFIEKVLPT